MKKIKSKEIIEKVLKIIFGKNTKLDVDLSEDNIYNFLISVDDNLKSYFIVKNVKLIILLIVLILKYNNEIDAKKVIKVGVFNDKND